MGEGRGRELEEGEGQGGAREWEEGGGRERCMKLVEWSGVKTTILKNSLQMCTCSKNSANSLTASPFFLDALFRAISSMVSCKNWAIWSFTLSSFCFLASWTKDGRSRWAGQGGEGHKGKTQFVLKQFADYAFPDTTGALTFEEELWKVLGSMLGKK